MRCVHLATSTVPHDSITHILIDECATPRNAHKLPSSRIENLCIKSKFRIKEEATQFSIKKSRLSFSKFIRRSSTTASAIAVAIIVIVVVSTRELSLESR